MKTVKRLLLVDDDRDDLELFATTLKEISISVKLKAVQSWNELKAFLDRCPKSELPNLAVLDLNMPYKDGIECLSMLKESPEYKHIPVVIFSTSVQPDVKQKCFQLGAMSCIEKPESYETYKDVVHYMVNLV
jgi:CheY-like chemotaxis protein